MSERREWVVALVLAWAFVLVRSAVFVWHEQSYFDSDQAIIGLMAKHLAEGRAFPLFFYGQSYMLGVEAWFAAPFLWVGGPTVAALRVAMVTLNLGVATLLITTLWKAAGLRPLYGLVASLFFVMAPPFTSALLVEAQGGSIEPFLYISVLWWLRRRPLWFGAVLGVGFLNREFTIYAVPVLLLGQLLTRQLWRRETARAWLVAAVAFFAVWESVNALKPYADLMGPGTRGQLLGGFAGSQFADVASRTSVSVTALPERIVPAVTRLFALLVNARPSGDEITQGHDWVWWPLMITLLALSVRILWSLRRGAAGLAERTGFCWYLVGVGTVALGAYAVARIPADGTLRYLLLTLLVPVGIVAGFLATEMNRVLRIAATAMVIAWAAVAATDNAAFIRRYASGQVPNQLREVADALVARGVRVTQTDYWRAYKVTYLTRELVRVASTDVARISEYQLLAGAAGADLRQLQAGRCAAGEPVGSFFLCPVK